jgi:DNA repair protein RecO (recombination protein O)
MGQYKTEAILLAVRNWGEADSMVTLFSREYGKINAVAYGARRPKNALAGSVQPFVHGEVLLEAGKSLDVLRQCEIKQSFRKLREELAQMAYATFLAELTSELWPERVAEPAVFQLILATFQLLGKRNPRLTALAGGVQLLSLSGFHPEIQHCVVCAEPVSYPAGFDSQAGGSICNSCAPESNQEFTAEVHHFLLQLLQLDWANPGHFSVNGAVLLQTEKLLAEFIACCLDKELKSLAFIATVTQ